MRVWRDGKKRRFQHGGIARMRNVLPGCKRQSLVQTQVRNILGVEVWTEFLLPVANRQHSPGVNQKLEETRAENAELKQRLRAGTMQ